jgi:hypothetical protein
MGFPLSIEGAVAYESPAAAEAALDAVAAYLEARRYVTVARRGDRLEFRRSGGPAPRSFAWATIIPSGALWIEGGAPALVRYRLSTLPAAVAGVLAAVAFILFVRGPWPERLGVAALALVALVGLNYGVAAFGFSTTLPDAGRAVPQRTARVSNRDDR